MGDENNVEKLNIEEIAEAILEDEAAAYTDPDSMGFNGVEGCAE